MTRRIVCIWKRNGLIFGQAHSHHCSTRIPITCSRKSFCDMKNGMNRVRAMMLLFALLGGTGAAVVQTVSSSSLACCAGEMCPAHKVHTGTQEKSHCEGVRSSDCPFSMDSSAANENAVGGPITTHAAIFQFRTALAEPKSSRINTAELPTRIASGYVASSEQPPRYPNQNNS